MLWHVGATTVLPPGYLCCGYPQTSGGDEARGQAITTTNRVLFHRVANTLNYLDIKTVIVSCGTCLDQLETYQFEKIFPGCRLIDIHEYLMEKGVKLDGVPGTQFMYHEPCHTPMKIYNGTKVANHLIGQRVDLSDRCCGESGTLAVTRPDVSTQVRFRKQQEIEAGMEKLKVGAGGTATAGSAAPMGTAVQTKILTSCPSCLQGLSRYREDAPIEADYIVVELARHILGADWLRQYVDAANTGGIERILL
jgi:Fe-S oxidoreductase